jgi:hypothetical protein
MDKIIGFKNATRRNKYVSLKLPDCEAPQMSAVFPTQIHLLNFNELNLCPFPQLGWIEYQTPAYFVEWNFTIAREPIKVAHRNGEILSSFLN